MIAELFSGYTEAYGTYIIPPDAIPSETGKRKGEARTIREPVSPELWQCHLLGEQGLGIIPIRETNDCLWGCVDIDMYQDFDPVIIVKKLHELSLPLWVFRSKSGGCHVVVFFSKPVAAVKVRQWLSQIASVLGFAQSEIFPKQTQLGPDNLGNWLNMPYFGGLNDQASTRFAYHPSEFTGLLLSEFESLCKSEDPEKIFKFTLKGQLKKAAKSNEFSDAPPCLEALCTAGKYPEGSRNCGLMNLALFRRKSIEDDDKWESIVFADNNRYMGPGSQNEVRQIIRSIRRKPYEYMCNEEPLSSHCNRGLCQTRRFGVTHHQATITGLQKIDTEPPVWLLQVEDDTVKLSTEQLHSQILFSRAVLEQINYLPMPRKPQDWTLLLRILLEKVQVIDMPYETSNEGRMSESIIEFIVNSTPADDHSQIHQGIPIDENGRTFFRSRDLFDYLKDHGYADIHRNRSIYFAMMKQMKIIQVHTPRKIAGVSTRLWSITTPERVVIQTQTPEEAPF